MHNKTFYDLLQNNGKRFSISDKGKMKDLKELIYNKYMVTSNKNSKTKKKEIVKQVFISN